MMITLSLFKCPIIKKDPAGTEQLKKVKILFGITDFDFCGIIKKKQSTNYKKPLQMVKTDFYMKWLREPEKH